MSQAGEPATRALLHLDRLAHNLRLLQALAGGRPLWPAIKANAYGHGAELVARALVDLGFDTLCVAHAAEAAALQDAGIRARFLLLSARLPAASELVAERGLEPVVCDDAGIDALARAAGRAGRRLSVHLMVDTGMGRIGIQPEDVGGFLERLGGYRELSTASVMSHFPRADEADKAYSKRQIERFRSVVAESRKHRIPVCHMANSAAIFDLPDSHLDAVRPGISIYGLAPSAHIESPRVAELRPVLEWTTRISFLKEVPAGTGLSYGHTFRTRQPSLVATIPVGYGDGLHRGLSNCMEVLIRGSRCAQVGTITMDQSLVDVTALRGRVELGDEVVLVGRQLDAEIRADELAATLGTINYEIVTSIAQRVPRVAVTASD